MIVDIARYGSCYSFDVFIFDILIDPFFLGELFMQKHNFIEKSVDIFDLRILCHLNRELSIVVQNGLSGMIAFPVHFNSYVVVSRL